MRIQLGETYGSESIDYQKARFFDELTAIFSKLLDLPVVTEKAIKSTGLEKLIMNRTGLLVDVRLQESSFLNAHIVPPDFGPNHPLIHPHWKGWYKGNDLTSLMGALKSKVLTGTVDRTKAKVSGDFSKVCLPIALYSALFTKKLLKAQHIAALTLHELGHGFTYFQCLGETLSSNAALITSAREFVDAKDKVAKINVLKQADKSLGITIADKDALAEGDVDNVYTVIMSQVITDTSSEFNSSLYDTRTWEALADQFSSRHGASAALAEALGIIYKTHNDLPYWSTPKYLMMESFKLLGWLALVGATAATGQLLLTAALFAILLINPYTDTYDSLSDRLKRIKEDLRGRFKDRSLDLDTIKSILNDVETIDKLMSEVHNRSTFFKKVWYYLVPSTRKQIDAMKGYQELEALANNSLYMASARLKTI